MNPTGPDSASPLPGTLLDAIREQKIFDAQGVTVPLHSNISLEEAEVLYRVILETKPDISAEIGFGQGISALAILKGLADNGGGMHHIIDPFQANYGDAGLAMVDRAGFSALMKFHRNHATDVLPGVARLDFAFIDSSHLFDLTLEEFVLVDKKLKVGGIIGFHDMWMPSLKKVIRYILANRSYRIRHDFFREPPGLPSLKERFKSLAGRLLERLPAGDRIFSQEILHPWHEFRLQNLVLLEKTEQDQRDWQWHRLF
jgi:predicted O-methyltransferase YrrM